MADENYGPDMDFPTLLRESEADVIKWMQGVDTIELMNQLSDIAAKACDRELPIAGTFTAQQWLFIDSAFRAAVMRATNVEQPLKSEIKPSSN